MYISQETLEASFAEMKEATPTAKTGMERTTSLFRFLAFDILSHEEKKDILAFPPDASDMRNRLIDKYDLLAKTSLDSEVSNFGGVGTPGRFGIARIGNDFLTSQLKQGSERRLDQGVAYPSRPAPILQIACGPNYWGVKKHSDWKTNLNAFLEGRSSRPFTNLSIYCLRTTDFGQVGNRRPIEVITEGLKKLFSSAVASYFVSRIELENGPASPLVCTWQEIPPSLHHLKAFPANDVIGNNAEPNSSETPELPNLLTEFQTSAKISQLRVAEALAHRLASSLLSKRFLIATGLAGSGKTKLAQAFAYWMTPSSLKAAVFSPGSEIKSATVTYYVKHSDAFSVEFWNAANEAEATKVSLPREMIAEWAAYIVANSIPSTTQAREIREAVKGTSKFSDQLHSFETHLKAAAFALVNSQLLDVTGRCHTIVPVGADWTGNENILGYPDGLQASNYVAKPALDLILHAADHADVPHFLILDEMNLSHVERYFADILSIIESDEGLDLYSGDMTKPETWRKTSAAKAVPPKLKQLPENLFIIGTVNVDETTYMFSPKVLDRANVIEFRMEAGALEGFLGDPAKPDLSKLDGKGASFGKAFVDAAMNPVTVPADVKAAYDAEMLLHFKTLQAHGAEFGYRTAYETARFMHFYKLLGNSPDLTAENAQGRTWFDDAFDCVVFQKLLPKLHGSRAKLGPVLKKLWFLCVNDAAGRGADALKAAEEAARSTDKKAEPSVIVPEGAPYPLSAEKIGRMWRLLIENGFASFAEA
jgi:tRNA A37 threonylcarbamoyladenosine biosynthesis protein TsaE